MLHLDLLRFVASAGIVWHHSREFFLPAAMRAAVTQRTQALALFVDLFFVISGFVIAFVYARRLTGAGAGAYGRFLQRRVARLFPLHWLTLAISVALWSALASAGIGARANHPPDRSAACVAQTALLLNGIVTCGNGNVLNGVTWSISAEMLLYLAFPLLLFVMNRRAIVLLAAIALVAAAWASPDGRWDTIYPPLRALPSFAFGMALHRWRDRLPAVPAGWPVPALVAVVLALMTRGVSQFVVLAAVWLLAAVAVAADRSRRAGRIVRGGAGLGRLTYGIYMWHALFILVMMNAVADKYLGLGSAAMAMVAVVCYAAILVWSYLSLRFFETPARRWIDRLAGGKGR